MKYISTRGGGKPLNFKEVVLAGLALDGGLYVPESYPQFQPHEIAEMAGLAYPDLMVKIITPFIGDELPQSTLHELARKSYAGFRHNAIAPLIQIAPNRHILELFHGETLAFKDFALQFLGNILEHLLIDSGRHTTIVGATSGDTGSAAIAGCRGKSGIDIYILHPENRVSEVQRRMMTTFDDANVHNLAIQGTFDDCQNHVKAMFRDSELRDKLGLTAINSINWVRILAQVVYYFYSALSLGAPFREVSFVVPTGNFGDIYAGYVAKQMGLPIRELMIATNQNDILHRFMETGSYTAKEVEQTIAPSIDIQISSNFERLLFDAYDRDASAINGLMQQFGKEASFTATSKAHNYIKTHFSSARAEERQVKSTMTRVYKESEYLLDPHTAVAVHAADFMKHHNVPLIILATAHPAKFPDVVREVTGANPALPPHHKDLFARPERFSVLPNDYAKVVAHIKGEA